MYAPHCCRSHRGLAFGSSPKDSNPQPPAPLGSAPAPRAPCVIPPLSAPLPVTPAPPGSLCSVSVAGSGDAAAQRGTAARLRRSSCEPPSDQPQEACLPPRSGGAASAGVVLLPPCMRHRRSACATSWDVRAGQELSRPLRRLLQATGAVLLRLGGWRGDLWLRAHGSEVLSAGVPPHGICLFPFFLIYFGSSLKDSNPAPPAPLGPAPAPPPLVSSHR